MGTPSRTAVVLAATGLGCASLTTGVSAAQAVDPGCGPAVRHSVRNQLYSIQRACATGTRTMLTWSTHTFLYTTADCRIEVFVRHVGAGIPWAQGFPCPPPNQRRGWLVHRWPSICPPPGGYQAGTYVSVGAVNQTPTASSLIAVVG